jgi:hypothetical protein
VDLRTAQRRHVATQWDTLQHRTTSWHGSTSTSA